MLTRRLIPCLLLQNEGLVKTVKFKQARYVGDPVNAVRIFNELEVDELLFLDIAATVDSRDPSEALVREISSECFMPLAYGGGIRDVGTVERLLRAGAEKVVIGTCAVHEPDVVREAARAFGSQSIVVSIDVRQTLLGQYRVHVRSGRENTGLDPLEHARMMEQCGAGELMINSIDRDGTMKGYDLALVTRLSQSVAVPVIASGGAGSLQDFADAFRAGASAAAAGSFFVFHGARRAVLINYPSRKDIDAALSGGAEE